MLDARRMTRNKFHAENTQILGATAQNLVARGTWPLVVLHPCVDIKRICCAILIGTFMECVRTQFHKHSVHISVTVVSLLFYIPQHNTYQMTRHMLEEGIFHSHCYWNLRFQIPLFVSVGMQLYLPSRDIVFTHSTCTQSNTAYVTKQI